MERHTILNREGKRIVIALDVHPQQEGLVFIAHGLGGNFESTQIKSFAQTFYNCKYTVVRWDATHTTGASEGSYEYATITNYLADMEDVIAWSATQAWYHEPFVLCGHSLGSICCVLIALKNPAKIRGLAPFSTVISGTLSLQAPMYAKERIDAWKNSGWEERKSQSIPGLVRRLSWSHFEDRLRYDILPHAHELTMPVLCIVGEKDDGTPAEHQKLFFDEIRSQKEFHIIPGAPHAFRESEHLAQIDAILTSWLAKL